MKTILPPRDQAERRLRVVHHRRFGPMAISAAHVLVEAELPPPDRVIAALAEIDRRHPAMTFRDFLGAAVLAQALALTSKPEGRA